MSRRVFLFAFLSTLGLACSSTPQVPVVDSVDLPSPLSKDSSGAYNTTVTIAAHSENGSITHIRMHVPPQNGVQFADLDTATGGAVSPFQVLLQIPGNVPAGTYTYQISVVDVSNAVSNPYNGSVTLQ